MKFHAPQIRTNSLYPKIYEWGKLISITGLSQISIQALGFMSGIMVIRLLPTKEYAFYTLANSLLGMMTMLSDAGIPIGVMAEGGKVWQDKEKLGKILATGFDLRKQFTLYSLVVTIPVLIYLLIHHDASWLTASLIILSIVPAIFAALSDSLLETIPKLHQNILPLQKNQLGVSVGRLILTALTLFFFPFAFIAVFASGIPRFFGNIQLKKIANKFIDKHQISDTVVRRDLMKVVKRALPGAIYYCFSGQITIWIISIFGNTASIAQVGALSRLGMLLSVISSILNVLVIPRFAKLGSNKEILLNRFLQIIGGSILLCFFIVAIVMLFPHQLLWILGKNYADLGDVLTLSIIGSCLILVIGISFGLYTSRGWIIKPVILIPLEIISVFLGLVIFNVSSLRGVFIFNIFIGSVQLIIHTFYALYKIRHTASNL